MAHLESSGNALHAAFETAAGAIKVAREDVQRERADLEKEKSAILASGVAPDDVVQLNVSGQVMAARRRTLCQVWHSGLQSSL
jgi:hypothetical protein